MPAILTRATRPQATPIPRMLIRRIPTRFKRMAMTVTTMICMIIILMDAARMTMVMMVQVLPNTSDIGQRFPALVYQALLEPALK